MIETERLILRPHAIDDFAPMLALYTDPAVFRFLAGVAPSEEDCWHRLLRYVGHWKLFGFGMYVVRARVDGRFLGEAGLADFHRGLGPGFDGAPEAAWIFSPAAQGQGFATEAVRAVHADFATRRAPARTVCIIDPANHASLRVADRTGYRPFGTCAYKGGRYAMLERDAG